MLANAGRIEGGAAASSYGVYDGDGGNGVIFGSAGTLLNAGVIQGGNAFYGAKGGAGAILAGAGRVVNHGLIQGGVGEGVGVSLGGPGTILNDGSILGGAGNDHYYKPGKGGTGVVLAGGGTLLNHGTVGGGNGGYYRNNGTNGGAGVVLEAGGMLSNTGTIFGGNGAYGSMHVGLGGTGVVLDGGTLTVSGAIEGGASGAGGELGAAVAFEASGNQVILEPGAVLQGGLSGFAAGDTIDLADVRARFLSYAGGTLTLSDSPYSNPGVVDRLVFNGSYTASDFALAADGHGGTDVLYVGSGALHPDFLPNEFAAMQTMKSETSVLRGATSLLDTAIAMLPGLSHAYAHAVA